MTPSKKTKMAKHQYFWDYQQKNPVSGRAMVRGKMLHFVAFFVHFEKFILPHPGPLWEGGEGRGGVGRKKWGGIPT